MYSHTDRSEDATIAAAKDIGGVIDELIMIIQRLDGRITDHLEEIEAKNDEIKDLQSELKDAQNRLVE